MDNVGFPFCIFELYLAFRQWLKLYRFIFLNSDIISEFKCKQYFKMLQFYRALFQIKSGRFILPFVFILSDVTPLLFHLQ